MKKLIDNFMSAGWTEKQYSRPRSFNLKYLYDHRIDANELRHLTQIILNKSSLGDDAIHMIKEKTRIIPQKF